MQSEGRQAHWETVYTEKGEDQVSWFQETPTPSLDLIAKVGATPASAIIDIGGGASRLVDNLVKRGFESVTVLDLSELEAAKSRLGGRAARVHWIVADARSGSPRRHTRFGMIGRRSTFSLRSVTMPRMSPVLSEP